MIGYVTVGTNDLARAARFYDAIAAEMGTGRMMEFYSFIAWGTPGGGAGIAATKPFDGAAATVGNGVMVALEASDAAQVDRLYAVALAHGGSDEGTPGLRPWRRSSMACRRARNLSRLAAIWRATARPPMADRCMPARVADSSTRCCPSRPTGARSR